MRNPLFLLIVFVVFLAACEPYPSASSYELMQSQQATAAAAESAAHYYGQQLTATAEAPLVQITQTAAAFQVQNQAAQATQQAVFTATAAAFTATAMQNEADLALANKHAQETAIANQAIRDDLELERQRMVNKTEALRPYLMLAFAAIITVVAVILIIRDKRFRPIPRDARGDAIPILDTVDATVINIDRNPNYLSTTKRDDMPLLPAVTADRQDQVTNRDQLIALATHGLPDGQKGQARRQMANHEISSLQQQSGRHEISIIPAKQALPVIKDVIPQIMQEAVDAEIISEEK